MRRDALDCFGYGISRIPCLDFEASKFDHDVAIQGSCIDAFSLCCLAGIYDVIMVIIEILIICGSKSKHSIYS